ncbi:hypothetical protein A9Q99_10000 [Gammaproteobacteria bacterium 45_16_T64]|nr:hypothetical protein A9Q99_10000 [Gammaproteobacteria bacterium 45_16_T64]
MLNRFYDWVVDRPFIAVLLCLVIAGAAAYGITGFKMDNNSRAFFGDGNPDLERLLDIEAKYGVRDTVLFIVHPKDDNIFTPETLSLLETLTERAWQMPKSVRVNSLTNFQHTQVDGDDLYTEYLIESAMTLSGPDLARIRSIALAEPSLVHSVVSEKGHVAVVVVNVVQDEQKKSAPMIAQWSRDLRDELREKHPEIEFRLSGSVIFSDAMGTATAEGIETFFPLSMGAAILCLILLLRSFLAMFFTMTIVILSVMAAMGLATTLGVVFLPITSYAPAIILTIGVADCVHILVSFQQQMRSNGGDKRRSILESVRINFQPIFLTSITTGIGFVCLNASESPPFRDLGNVVVIGVVFAWFLSIVLLPALMMIFPAPKLPSGDGWLQKQMMRFSEFVIRRKKGLFWGVGFLVFGTAAFLPLNKFNDVWVEYFDKSYDVRRASEFLADEVTGLHRIQFSLPAIDKGGVSEPEYLEKLNEFKEWAEAQPEVVYALTLSDVVKRLNRNMNGGDETFYRVPDSRALASQYLLMYEMSLPFGLGLDDVMTMDKDESSFHLILDRTSSDGVLQFSKKAGRWIEENMPEYMHAKPTGLDVLFSQLTRRNVMSMLSGTLGAFLLISAMIVVSLRSVRYGLMSLLPNMMPAAVAFGLWGLTMGNVGVSVSIVACLTIGIVVDDTVHFLSKYVRAKREQNLSTEDAVRYAFSTVGVALITTSIVLVANFSVIAFSSFYPSSNMGTLTSLTIVLALIVDLLFFAPFLLLLDGSKSSKTNTDNNIEEKDDNLLPA